MMRIPAAILLGIAYITVAKWAWSFYGPANPVDAWLIDTIAGRGGFDIAYRVARSIHYVLVNALIAAPFVAALVFIPKLDRRRHFAMAALAAAVFAISTAEISWALVESLGYWFDSAIFVCGPLLAYAGLRAIKR